MKKLFFISLLCTFTNFVLAQKSSCGCKTKQGEYAVTTDGEITYKGKNAKGQFLYDLSITFKNEVNCAIFIPTIQFNDNDLIFEPKIKLESKGKKKPYRKMIISNTKLKPVLGLDDATFADMLVDYELGEKACNLSVTIGYAEVLKK